MSQNVHVQLAMHGLVTLDERETQKARQVIEAAMTRGLEMFDAR